MIHVVLCVYNRIELLPNLLYSLRSQTVAKLIVLHIINNNPKYKKIINSIILEHIRKTRRNTIKIVVSHKDNSHSCFERFFYIRDLIKNNKIPYIIIIDDDQLFPKKWVDVFFEWVEFCKIDGLG